MIKTSITFPETLSEVYWLATLNDHTKVYRNDIGEKDSWLVFKEFLNDSDKYITGLHFFFRDNYVEIGWNKSAFFFTKMIKGEYGGSTQFFFCGGYLNDDGKSVHIKKYVLPELLIMEEEDRNINDPTLERGLIFNRVKNQS